jgi:putative transposase
MPVYGEAEETPKFSGRRVTHQYRTKEGVILNADVNGAGNIIRKRYPDAFRDMEDYSYLTKTVTRITREQLCGVLHTKKQGKPKWSGMRPYLHHEHMAKKLGYMKLFGQVV